MKTAYTNEDGYFRIVGLVPGTFEVRASAPKLRTVVHKELSVGISAPVDVTLVMEVETDIEEVKVIERAPVVSTTSANVKETFDSEFLENLPLDDRLNVIDMVAQNTPGSHPR